MIDFVLTVRGGLAGIRGDHPLVIHALLNIWMLVHQCYSSLSPRTRPFQLTVIGTRSQVQVHGHTARTARYSINIETNLERVAIRRQECGAVDLGADRCCGEEAGEVLEVPYVMRALCL